MTKHILFIDVTPDNRHSSNSIEEIAKSYEYTYEYRQAHTKEGLLVDIRNYQRPFDILYIGAHGNKNGIGLQNQDGEDIGNLCWRELGQSICGSEGLQENSTVYLACCDGGFKRTALTIFGECLKVNIIAGVACDLNIRTEALVFHTFLEQIRKNNDAERTQKAVQAATDHQFNIFLRQDHDVEIGQFAYMYLGYNPFDIFNIEQDEEEDIPIIEDNLNSDLAA